MAATAATAVTLSFAELEAQLDAVRTRLEREFAARYGPSGLRKLW
jgi:hypothetical protein